MNHIKHFYILLLISSCFAEPVKLEWNLNDWGRTDPPLAWWVWKSDGNGGKKYITGTRYYWDDTQKINVIVEAQNGDVFIVQASHAYGENDRSLSNKPEDVSLTREITINSSTPRVDFAHKFTVQKTTDLKNWETEQILYFKERFNEYTAYDIKFNITSFSLFWNSIPNWYSPMPIYHIPKDVSKKSFYRIKMETGNL